MNPVQTSRGAIGLGDLDFQSMYPCGWNIASDKLPGVNIALYGSGEGFNATIAGFPDGGMYRVAVTGVHGRQADCIAHALAIAAEWYAPVEKEHAAQQAVWTVTPMYDVGFNVDGSRYGYPGIDCEPLIRDEVRAILTEFQSGKRGEFSRHVEALAITCRMGDKVRHLPWVTRSDEAIALLTGE